MDLFTLLRGSYFGGMSLLTGEPRAATGVAVQDAVLLESPSATTVIVFLP